MPAARAALDFTGSMQKIISIAAILAAAFSAAFVFLAKPSGGGDSGAENAAPEGRLKGAIPAETRGWTSKDGELGDTEEVKRAAEKVLNVTDYVNRSYSKDGSEFTVYIAYWKPDTMEIHRASSHSPDRCWVANGWKNLEDGKSEFSALDIGGMRLFGGFSRAYSISTERGTVKRYVWYWHIVDGKPYDYGKSDNFTPTFSNWLRGVFSAAVEGMPEQYFIRVDSSVPLEGLKADAGFAEVMKSLGKLVLEEKRAE